MSCQHLFLWTFMFIFFIFLNLDLHCVAATIKLHADFFFKTNGNDMRLMSLYMDVHGHSRYSSFFMLLDLKYAILDIIIF